jgi:hypothetical protein
LQIGQKIIPVKEESSFKTLAVKEAKNEKSIEAKNGTQNGDGSR